MTGHSFSPTGNPDDGHTWLIAATELTVVDGTPTVPTG